MKLFALADLHLAGSVDKPMDIFGPRWSRHAERIIENWKARVGPDDTVLIGGDISWAKSLVEVLPDLSLIDSLPGRKILLRGNHDYWWTTLKKLDAFCSEQGLATLSFLRNDALKAAGFLICGTRGWILPTDEAFSAADEKIFKREVTRLELSIAALERIRKAEPQVGATIALMHYPPISERGEASAFSERLSRAGVDLCLFGHIHHHAPYYDSRPQLDGVRYIMVASDQVGFCPVWIGTAGQLGEKIKGDPDA